MRLSLRLASFLECRVCRLNASREVEKNLTAEVALFGNTKYIKCPNCQKPVDERSAKDKNYRRRWRQFVRKTPCL